MLAAREFVRSFALGKFKAQLPQRSGLLKQKAYIRQRDGKVQLRGVWYARLVKYLLGLPIEPTLGRQPLQRLRTGLPFSNVHPLLSSPLKPTA